MGAARAEGGGEPLFLDFFFLLRQAGLPVSTTEWLTFVEALAKGLVAADLHRFYALARATLVKSEKHYDLFDQAFAHYFVGTAPGLELKKALEAWLATPIDPPQLSPEALEMMERYGLDELRRMFEERLREQTERHDGGNKWVGTGGTSPFGHGGQNPAGVRVGGSGGGRSAVQIAARRRFRDYRTDLVLDVRQLGLALRKLRRLGRDGAPAEVDIDATIDHTARNAGDLEIAFRPPRHNKLKVLLLMDVGGSMDPFAHLVSRLFTAAHKATHFREFHAYYFHNCVYERVYEDARLSKGMLTVDLLRWLQPETRVIWVGDAHMAPYELTAEWGAIDYTHQNPNTGLEWLQRLARHFTHQAWLNPIERRFWRHPTIAMIGDVLPMHELTLEGLEDAVDALR